MAKRKPHPDESGHKKTPRSGTALNLYIDDDLREAMNDFMAEYNAANEHHATVRSTVEGALRMYLRDKGHWPRKARRKPVPE